MEGDVRALDLETGRTDWIFPLRGEEGNRAVYGTPALGENGDLVFVGGYDGRLYALSTDNGKDEWETIVGAGSPIVGGPVVAGGLVLVGSSDGNLYAYSAAEGAFEWRFPTGHMVWSAPAVEDGVAYFGSLDHNVYAVSIGDGSELWRFPADGAVTARPVVANGRVFVGSFGSIFLAIDAQTGNEVWRFDKAAKWFWGGAVVAEDTVFAPSLDGNLYALDVDTGFLKWAIPTQGAIVGAPSVVRDRIAVGSTDGAVRIARLKDGEDIIQCNVGSKLRTPLAAHEDLLYLGATDHTIRALRVKPNGNPDEEWVHYSKREDPTAFDPGYNPPC